MDIEISNSFESKIGILILVDIVNFSGQARRLGDIEVKKGVKKVETILRSVSRAFNVHFIKPIGDAFLLFVEGADINRLRLFLDFVSDLRDKSIEGSFDHGEFIADLRCVAHFGNFQFEIHEGRIVDMLSVEGTKVFRMEKEADRYEVVVTEHLFSLVKNILPKKKISGIAAGERKFKGYLDTPTRLYKLMFPEKEVYSEQLELQMVKLEKACQTIPVFGGLAPAISMKKNFINLSIKGGLKGKYHYLDIGKKIKMMEGLDAHERRERIESLRTCYSEHTNVSELYEKYNHGTIFGLPGSGKTTILRYFAYRDFKKNTLLKVKNKRVVLFFHCRIAWSYNEWCEELNAELRPDYEDIESILGYLTFHFLFGKRTYSSLNDKEKKEYFKAEKEVLKAYADERLTLLLDALDESGSSQVEEGVVTIYKRLAENFSRTHNKIYLTSRYSEKEAFFDHNEEHVFEVCSLDKEQLREMARYFYAGETELYEKFDDAVWKEEIAAKVGGTPVTALLLLTYFRIYLSLGSRYHMYDVLIKFILFRTWKEIKEKDFARDPVVKLLKQARNGDVFAENRDMESLYDALSMLAYDYILVGESALTRTSIVETLALVAKDDRKVEKWFDTLVKEHLLLFAGWSEKDEEYVFIHETVMEYLAARYIVGRMERTHIMKLTVELGEELSFFDGLRKNDQRFFDSETLPIASGSSLNNGFRILAVLQELVQERQDESIRQSAYVCAYRTLAELERSIERKIEKARTRRLRDKIKEEIKAHQVAFTWVYLYLKNLVLNQDETHLTSAIDRFTNISNLSLSELLDAYITFPAYQEGDSSIVHLRKDFLYTIMNKRVVDDWFFRNEKRRVELLLQKEKKRLEAVQGNMLQFDSLTYNPADKNFNYYHKITGGLLAGFFGSPNLKHSGRVTCTAVTPDGKHAVSGSSDHTIKLWDLATGKEVCTLKGHCSPIIAVTVTPRGDYLISGSQDGFLKLWNLPTGNEFYSFKGHDSSITGVAVTPDGQYVLSCSDDQSLKLWEISSGKELKVFRGHSHYVNAAVITNNGKYIVSASFDRTLKLWNISSGKEIRTFKGHNNYVTCVALTPDNKYLISGSSDGIIKLWNISTGKSVREFRGSPSPIAAVEVTSDGKYLVLASFDNTLKIWNLSNDQKIQNLKGHTDHVNSISVTVDGNNVLSGSSDKTLKLWNLSKCQEIRAFKGHTDQVNEAAVTPNGKFVISGSSDNTIRLWDISTGEELWIFTGHTDRVNGVVVTPDGKNIISASSDKTLKSWDILSGKEIRTYNGHTSDVNCAVIMPGGEQFVSGSADHTARLWNLSDSEEKKTFKGHHSQINSITTTPDGRHIISGSSDKTLKLWEMFRDNEILTFEGHDDNVTCATATSDGKYIVSGSDDGTLRVWSIFNGKEIDIYEGHSDIVTCVAVTKGGEFIVSGSFDMTLRIWDMKKKTCVRAVELPWIPLCLQHVQGKESRLVACNRNGTVTLFDFDKIFT